MRPKGSQNKPKRLHPGDEISLDGVLFRVMSGRKIERVSNEFDVHHFLSEAAKEANSDGLVLRKTIYASYLKYCGEHGIGDILSVVKLSDLISQHVERIRLYTGSCFFRFKNGDNHG